MCHPRYAMWIVLIWVFSFGLVRLASTWIPGIDRLSDVSVVNLLDYGRKISLSGATWIALLSIPVIWAVWRRRR